MTLEEFLPSLSVKTQNIVKSHIKTFHKPVQVYLADILKMRSKKSCFEIYINNQIHGDYDEKFLHEFFHCVQEEENFPSLYALNNEHRELATSISSLILDVDIRERLINNGYSQCIDEVKYAIQKQTELLELLLLHKVNKQNKSILELIDVAGVIFTGNTLNLKNQRLMRLTKKLYPESLKYLTVLNESINLYSYNTADGLINIFNLLIKKLGLPLYITSQTQKEDE